MQRALTLLLLILASATAWADGMVFPPAAFPAHVNIPDQRALLHYTNGVERLVIETRFTGAGTNFAWVVPLPSRAVIEPASTGLFPTLQYLFQPTVRHNVPRHYLWMLTGLLLYLLFVGLRRVTGEPAIIIILLFGVCGILAALLLPALGRAKSSAMGTSSPESAVSVLDRQMVGVFETTTIASTEPKVLQQWLQTNGFAILTNSVPVLETYVKEGWVFVAAKLRRDQPAEATSTPHPLSFTFKTPRPVYPMRLTGVGNGPLQVELYVFGPGRARAPGFRTQRCTQPDYPAPPGGWSFGLPKRLPILHPLLRQWVYGAPVATKLTARLTPAQMRRDVWLDWVPFSEQEHVLYSYEGAWAETLNWGMGTFVVCLVLVRVFIRTETGKKKLAGRDVQLGTLLFSLLVSAMVYLDLPKTEVRLERRPASWAYNNLLQISFLLQDQETDVTGAQARAVLVKASHDSVGEEGKSIWKNPLLGGRIHEEDSPGNFVLRQSTNGFDFLFYDGMGAEHSVK